MRSPFSSEPTDELVPLTIAIGDLQFPTYFLPKNLDPLRLSSGRSEVFIFDHG